MPHKKAMAALSAPLFLSMLGGCAPQPGAELVPLESLPADYSLEQAKEDGCVVMEDLSVTSGQEVWDNFVKTASAGKKATVRLGYYYTLDPDHVSQEYYEANKDRYPVLFIRDLTFDGEKYVARGYENGEEIVQEYPHLMKYEGKTETPHASYGSYVHYVLTLDDTVTWEQLQAGMLSSQLGDHIPHSTVYTDLR